MADILQAREFWLPPEFFTGDGILSDETNPPLFPFSTFNSDFPAKSSSSLSLSSSAFSSPVESVLGSTETDTDEEDDSLTELTRCFSHFTLKPNQNTWDLSNADVAKQAGMMKMNGVDEGLLKSSGKVGPHVGPTPLVHNLSYENNNFSKSFYVNQFPLHQDEPKKEGQITNETYGSILGRPSVDDLLLRQIQFRQYLISQHRNKVLTAYQSKENVKYLHSSLGLPYLARPYPLGEHQMNRMSTVAPLGMFGKKQACAGTGVFIPRPYTNPLNAPNKSGAGRHNAQHPPRFYQPVNKNSTLTAAQAFMAPHHDTVLVRSNTIQTQNMPGLKLDGLLKHEQCLPQEWSY